MVGFWRALWVFLTWRRRGVIGLFDVARVTLRVMPAEIDFNLHMNNGRYFSAADIGRLDWGMRTNLWRKALQHGFRPMAGDSNGRFSSSLQPLQRYALETRMLGWNGKWFFCEHRFVREQRVCATVLVRYLFVSRRGKVPPAKLLQMTGYDSVSPPLPEWVLRWNEAQESLSAALKAEAEAAAAL